MGQTKTILGEIKMKKLILCLLITLPFYGHAGELSKIFADEEFLKIFQETCDKVIPNSVILKERACLTLGNWEYEKGNIPEAKRYWRMACNNWIGTIDACALLGWQEHKEGNTEEGKALLGIACKDRNELGCFFLDNPDADIPPMREPILIWNDWKSNQ